MSEFHSLLTIAGVFLLTVSSPGPSFLLISSTAAAVSRRAGLLTGLGVATATLIWASAVVLGLGLVLTQLGWLYQGIRILGVAYLVWLGLRLIWSARRGQTLNAGVSTFPNGAGNHWRRGFLLAFSNPTTAVYFGSVFSNMLPSAASTEIYAAAVAIVTIISLIWHCGIAMIFGVGVGHGFLRQRTALPIVKTEVEHGRK